MYDTSKCAARVIARRVKIHGASKFTVGQNAQQVKLCVQVCSAASKCTALITVQRVKMYGSTCTSKCAARKTARRVKMCGSTSKCAVRKISPCVKM